MYSYRRSESLLRYTAKLRFAANSQYGALDEVLQASRPRRCESEVSHVRHTTSVLCLEVVWKYGVSSLVPDSEMQRRIQRAAFSGQSAA